MKRYIFLLLLLTALTKAGFTQHEVVHPTLVARPVYFDISPPLREMLSLPPSKGDNTWKDGVVKNFFNVKKRPHVPDTAIPVDQSVQDYMGNTTTDTTIQNFEGVNNLNGYYPPDTHGDVGPNHYFQVVNASYKIFNKSGVGLYGPVNNSTMWTGLPNNTNSGDAVVLYDEIADRWLFTQFSLPNYPNGPFYQMIAVSQTADPTGSWYRWEYSFADMPDYPKFGIWPDGYYMSINRFTSGAGNYAGTGAVAFDRTAMLAGNASPTMVYFTLAASNEAYSFLPADCDGTFPPIGTPEYFTYINEAPDHLRIYELAVNWTTPSASTFGNFTTLNVNTFTTTGLSGVPQLNTTRRLDDLSDRLMYRCQFRKFNDHWSMVTNHTVNANVSSSNNTGIRWYELRKTTGAWSVYQQATFAPDTRYRWMASAAMDTSGNIGLGYSISSSTMYPGIKYCGRMSSDALGTLGIAEKGIFDGGGSQTGTALRWGDYSSISIDPSAPATFWYTTEYYATTSSTGWKTRIASFSFLSAFSVLATAFPSTIDLGNTSQLNATTTGGTAPFAFSWTSLPAGFTSNLQNPVVSPTVTTQYIVHVTSGAQVTTDTATVTVTMLPLVVQATATPSLLCEGQSTQLSASASGGALVYTWQWTSIPPGFTSNLQNPAASPLVSTKYIVSCNDGFIVVNDTVQVDVTSSPAAFAGNDSTYCKYVLSIDLHGTAANYAAVQWSTSGDGTFSNSNLPETIYFPGITDKNNMAVVLTLSATPLAPCSVPVSSVKRVTFDPCTGLPEQTGNSVGLTIAPNPAHDKVVLKVNGLYAEPATLSITGMDGRMVYVTTLAPSQNTVILKIDISTFAKGTYVIKLTTRSATVTEQLLVR